MVRAVKTLAEKGSKMTQKTEFIFPLLFYTGVVLNILITFFLVDIGQW